MAKNEGVVEGEINRFLNVDHVAFVTARQKAQRSFVESRFAHLLHEFIIFASDDARGLGPWLLQLEPKSSGASSELHFWVSPGLLPDGITEEDMRGQLFSFGSGESWPGRDQFVYAFNSLLEEKGLDVRLKDDPFRRRMRFVPAEGFHY